MDHGATKATGIGELDEKMEARWKLDRSIGAMINLITNTQDIELMTRAAKALRPYVNEAIEKL